MMQPQEISFSKKEVCVGVRVCVCVGVMLAIKDTASTYCKNVAAPSYHIIHGIEIKSRFTFNYLMQNDSQANPVGG